MLRHKGVAYRRVDLPTVTHRTLLRALGYPRKTVPAIRIDGAKVQGTTDIARALDALIPSKPLFPSDPDQRREVEAADFWGDEVLQPVPRRLTLNALKHDRSALRSYLEDARLGVPVGLVAPVAPLIASRARWCRTRSGTCPACTRAERRRLQGPARSVGTPAYARQCTWKPPHHSGSLTSA